MSPFVFRRWLKIARLLIGLFMPFTLNEITLKPSIPAQSVGEEISRGTQLGEKSGRGMRVKLEGVGGKGYGMGKGREKDLGK